MNDPDIVAQVMFAADKEVVQACSILLAEAPTNALLMSPIKGNLYKCNLCGCGLLCGTQRAVDHLREEHFADALRAQRQRFVSG